MWILLDKLNPVYSENSPEVNQPGSQQDLNPNPKQIIYESIDHSSPQQIKEIEEENDKLKRKILRIEFKIKDMTELVENLQSEKEEMIVKLNSSV